MFYFEEVDVRILEVWAIFRVKILEKLSSKKMQGKNSVCFIDFAKQHRVDFCSRNCTCLNTAKYKNTSQLRWFLRHVWVLLCTT